MFLKHYGKSRDKRVALMWDEVPGEEHMALVVFLDSLPAQLYDQTIKLLESPAGQEVTHFNEACNRAMTPDSINLLTALHTKGYIKKVPCADILMTPNNKTAIKLTVLKEHLKALKAGETSPQYQELENTNEAGLATIEKMREMQAKKRLYNERLREAREEFKGIKQPQRGTTSADIMGESPSVIPDVGNERAVADYAKQMEQKLNNSLMEDVNNLAGDRAAQAKAALAAVTNGASLAPKTTSVPVYPPVVQRGEENQNPFATAQAMLDTSADMQAQATQMLARSRELAERAATLLAPVAAPKASTRTRKAPVKPVTKAKTETKVKA